MPERGLWCNRCGTRLAPGGQALWRGQAAPRHSLVWVGDGGECIAWSLCAACRAEKMRCRACDSPIESEVVLLDGVEQVYCRACYDGRPRCDTCGRPVGAHYWARPDGRQMCDRCQSTSVTDALAAHALYRRVRASILRTLGMALSEPCQLKVVGRRQMLRLLDKSALYHLDAGSRGRCFGLFLREGRHRAVFVEYGLPRIVLLEVLAHEYAHAWQSEQCRPDMPLEMQEGFAEWVAYKLMQSWGCHRRTARMLRRDDIYGQGLRMVLEWERLGGTRGVFRRVRL